MQTIWKFVLPITDIIKLEMPRGAQLLTVQQQREHACLWAMVDDGAKLVTRTIAIKGTGHPVGEVFARPYLGTFQPSSNLVFHVFDLGEEE